MNTDATNMKSLMARAYDVYGDFVQTNIRDGLLGRVAVGEYCRANNIEYEHYVLAETHFVQNIWNKGKSIDLFEYFVTFTLKPEANATEALAYIKGLPKRKALRITKFELVGEETKNGVPHWHTLITSVKSIVKNRFDYYAKKYGFVDYKRIKDGDREEVLNYMSKVNEVEEVAP